MKQVRMLMFTCLLIFMLFSTNVYAAPVNAQEDFQSGLTKGKISLGSNITFDFNYESDISSLSLKIVNRARGVILEGTDVNSPVRLLTKEYDSGDNLEFTLTLKGNISIKKFSLKEDESSEISGFGGAIYVNNIGNGQSKFILKGTGKFIDNSVAGASVSISSFDEEEQRVVSFDNSGLGGTIYGSTLLLQEFEGSFEGNSALGGTIDTFIPDSGTLKIEISNSGLGGAIYADNITLKKFTGNFISNSASEVSVELQVDKNLLETILEILESFSSQSEDEKDFENKLREQFSVITNNGGSGGAIYGGVITLKEFKGNFDSNQASNDGGAIYADTIAIDNFKGDFKGNIAGSKSSYISYIIDESAFESLDEGYEGYFKKENLVYILDALLKDNSELKGLGGAIYARNKVEIKNFTGNFSDNIASNSGGAIYGDIIDIDNFKGDFRGNIADDTSLPENSEEQITTEQIISIYIDLLLGSESGLKGFGGALYAGSSVGIKDFTGSFNDNKASNSGGAIYSNTITIDNFKGDFNGNTAGDMGSSELSALVEIIKYQSGTEIEPSGLGGALYAGSSVGIKDFTGSFNDNKTSNSGGAIYSNTITIDNFKGDFNGNIAGGIGSSELSFLIEIIKYQSGIKIEQTGFGGALYAGSSVGIKDFTGNFNDNKTSSSGGAIYSNEITIDNFKGDFNGNIAGGIGSSELSFLIEIIKYQSGIKIEQTGLGGALYAGSSAVIKDFTGSFSDNKALNSGGAIYSDEITIDNFKGDFNGNIAGGTGSSELSALVEIIKYQSGTEIEPSGLGGALYAGNSVGIKDFTGSFSDNKALNSGGAIYSDEITIDNFKGDFNGNAAGSTGLVEKEEFQIYIDLIVSMKSESSGLGGAIYARDKVEIKNFTGNFTDNMASSNGGAIYGETITLNNFGGDFTGNVAGVARTSDYAEMLFVFQALNDKEVKPSNFGGALYGNSVEIKNFTGNFIDNMALKSGGAIYSNTITIDNFKGNFEGNIAGVGSSNENTGGIISSPEFLGALALIKYMYTISSDLSFGGALYGNSVEIKNFAGNFTDNMALNSGGAIYSNTITIDNFKGDFKGNSAGMDNSIDERISSPEYAVLVDIIELIYSKDSEPTGLGGALYGETISIKNFTGNFNNNTAFSNGGAIYGNELTIDNFKGDFKENVAGIESPKKNSGDSVILFGYEAFITIYKLIYSKDSKPTGFGGALYSSESVDIKNFTGSFNNNRALNSGGAIYSDKITLDNFEGDFSGNVAGVESSNENVSLSQYSEFVEIIQILYGNDSEPTGFGGALYSSENVDIKDFTGSFSDNTAFNSGGAIYSNTITLNNFKGDFKGNVAGVEKLKASTSSELSKILTVFQVFFSKDSRPSGFGGAIRGESVDIKDFTGNFSDNTALNSGGAVYAQNITITNFEGSFKNNSALGGNINLGIISDELVLKALKDIFEEADLFVIGSLGLGGAIYGNTIDLENFNGSFESNSVAGISSTSNDEGTQVYIHSSGRGGAIYLYATDDSSIDGGIFKGNFASTDNIDDMTSGLGGAIFFDVQKDDVRLLLTSSVDTPISFIKNTHAPGGEANKTYNSIYFGTTATGNEAGLKATLSVEVDEDAYLVMKDPMASQEDSMIYIAEAVYDSIALTIDKTGEGTWILGGHNDMQSKTTWTISEGTLQLSEDLASKVAHIDLSHDDSSFTMAEGTSLLLAFTKNGHKIQAEEIKLESTIAPTDADYGNLKEGDTYTLLKLISEDISVNESLISESGKVTVGAFDYTYTDGILLNESDAEPNVRNYIVTIDSKKFDPIKGGVDLLMAPLATSVTDIVRSDMFYSENKVNPWAKLGYGVTNHADYRTDRIDATLGIDLRITDNVVGGLTGGWSKVFFEGLDTSMEGNIINFGILTALKVPYEIEVVMAGAVMETNYAYTRGEIEGNLHSRTFKAGLEIGRGFELVKNLTLSPNLGYTYMNVLTGDVDEMSESALALHIDSHTENIHRVNVGAMLTYNLFDKAQISLSTEYVGTFGDTSVKSNAYFSNDPLKQYFETYSEKAIDTHAFKLGLEGKVDLGDSIMFLVNYMFKVGSDSTEHIGDFKFNFIW